MRRIVALALFVLCAAVPAAAQEWPTKTVRVIVPFGAGATPDTIARLIADKLQAKLGQNFIVENKPGASGMLGTDAVAKAEADGYTIGISIGGPLAINTLLFSKMPYDPFKDLALITILTTQPSALAVPANLGVNSVAELVALIKKDPGKYNFGSIGNGSLSHLAMEAIAIKSGAKLVHIPYGSSPQAMTAVIRGDVQMAVMPAISVVPHVQAGTVKMLAVTTAKRSPLLPDVPTLKESGIDVEADAWNGLIAPAGTPPAILEKIRREVAEAINSPELKEKFAAQIMGPVGNTPTEFKAQIDSDLARWTPVIKDAGIKVN
ncbi:MAG: tripartite tricarboxylate transporter substrate binding protein [Alphaproteobacteria bacterium]|nr:MAG: tripartite tricarboxylate transporter substrate binding protein [Alphaproteobacteria bacterium]